MIYLFTAIGFWPGGSGQ